MAVRTGRKRSFGDRILKLLSIMLLISLIVLIVHTEIKIKSMRQKLSALNSEIGEEQMLNDDLNGMLENQDEYMERLAREKLDFAAPGEEVFIDVSGDN